VIEGFEEAVFQFEPEPPPSAKPTLIVARYIPPDDQNRGVVDVLRQESVTVISIDKNGGDTTYTMPKSAHLVVNIMTPGAIREYIDEKFIGPSTTVLNEVYPAPHQELVEEMNSLGADVFHIVGVVADAYPSFPKAYRGAVPCCAALTDANYRVGITKL
jgi:hypothetical protein